MSNTVCCILGCSNVISNNPDEPCYKFMDLVHARSYSLKSVNNMGNLYVCSAHYFQDKNSEECCIDGCPRLLDRSGAVDIPDVSEVLPLPLKNRTGEKRYLCQFHIERYNRISATMRLLGKSNLNPRIKAMNTSMASLLPNSNKIDAMARLLIGLPTQSTTTPFPVTNTVSSSFSSIPFATPLTTQQAKIKKENAYTLENSTSLIENESKEGKDSEKKPEKPLKIRKKKISEEEKSSNLDITNIDNIVKPPSRRGRGRMSLFQSRTTTSTATTTTTSSTETTDSIINNNNNSKDNDSNNTNNNNNTSNDNNITTSTSTKSEESTDFQVAGGDSLRGDGSKPRGMRGRGRGRGSRGRGGMANNLFSMKAPSNVTTLPPSRRFIHSLLLNPPLGIPLPSTNTPSLAFNSYQPNNPFESEKLRNERFPPLQSIPEMDENDVDSEKREKQRTSPTIDQEDSLQDTQIQHESNNNNNNINDSSSSENNNSIDNSINNNNSLSNKFDFSFDRRAEKHKWGIMSDTKRQVKRPRSYSSDEDDLYVKEIAKSIFTKERVQSSKHRNKLEDIPTPNSLPSPTPQPLTPPAAFDADSDISPVGRKKKPKTPKMDFSIPPKKLVLPSPPLDAPSSLPNFPSTAVSVPPETYLLPIPKSKPRRCWFPGCGESKTFLRLLLPYAIPSCDTHSQKVEEILIEKLGTGEVIKQEGPGKKDSVCGVCMGLTESPEAIRCHNETCAFVFCQKCMDYVTRRRGIIRKDWWSCWPCEHSISKARPRARATYISELLPFVKDNNNNNDNDNNNTNNQNNNNLIPTTPTNQPNQTSQITTTVQTSTSTPSESLIFPKSVNSPIFNSNMESGIFNETTLSSPTTPTHISNNTPLSDQVLYIADSLKNSLQFFSHNSKIDSHIVIQMNSLADTLKQLIQDTPTPTSSPIGYCRIWEWIHLIAENFENLKSLSHGNSGTYDVNFVEAIYLHIKELCQMIMLQLKQMADYCDMTSMKFAEELQQAFIERETLTTSIKSSMKKMEDELQLIQTEEEDLRAKEKALLEEWKTLASGIQKCENSRKTATRKLDDIRGRLVGGVGGVLGASESFLGAGGVESRLNMREKLISESKALSVVSGLVEDLYFLPTQKDTTTTTTQTSTTETTDTQISTVVRQKIYTPNLLSNKKGTLLIYHDLCLEHRVPSDHLEQPERLRIIVETMHYLHSRNPQLTDIFSNPQEVEMKYLTAVHDPKYINKLRTKLPPSPLSLPPNEISVLNPRPLSPRFTSDEEEDGDSNVTNEKSSTENSNNDSIDNNSNNKNNSNNNNNNNNNSTNNKNSSDSNNSSGDSIENSSMKTETETESSLNDSKIKEENSVETFTNREVVIPLSPDMSHISYSAEHLENVDQNLLDTFISQHSLQAALRAAGAVCEAVDAIMKPNDNNNNNARAGYSHAFAAVRPPGHHAGRNGRTKDAPSQGFCLINNVVIGARYALLNYPMLQKIAIVDFDVHHGNGTQELVEGDENFMFYSIHVLDEKDWFYPGTGEEIGDQKTILEDPSTPIANNDDSLINEQTSPVNTDQNNHNVTPFPSESNNNNDNNNNNNTCFSCSHPPAISQHSNIVNVPLRRGSSSHTFMAAFYNKIIKELYAYAPDLIFVSAGFDGHKKDPTCGLRLSEDDYFSMTKLLKCVANKHCGGKIISVLEGGYAIEEGNNALRKCVESHLRALTIDSDDFTMPTDDGISFWVSGLSSRRMNAMQKRNF